MEENQAKFEVTVTERWNWSVSIGSFVAVWVLLFFGDTFVEGFHYASAQARLEYDLDNGVSITEINANADYQRLLDKKHTATKLALTKAIDVTEVIETTDYKKAFNIFRTKGFADVPVKEELEEILARLADESSLVNSREKIEQDLSKRSQAVIDRFETLHGLMQGLFKAETPVTTGEKMPKTLASLAFYSTGMLQGLPVVSGMSDGIADEAQLKKHLERGRLNQHGREQLAQLKLTSRELSVEFENLTKEKEIYDLNLSTKQVERAVDIERVNELARTSILILSKPRIDRSSVWTYNHIRIFLAAYGYKLPQLRARSV